MGPLLALADHYSTDSDVRIVVVSEGPGADQLRDHATKRGLKSLIVVPYEPFQAVPAMMAEADVLIAALTSRGGLFLSSLEGSELPLCGQADRMFD